MAKTQIFSTFQENPEIESCGWLGIFLAKEVIFHTSEVHLCGQMSWEPQSEAQSWWSLLGVGDQNADWRGTWVPDAELVLGWGPQGRLMGEQQHKDSGMHLSSWFLAPYFSREMSAL